MLRGKLICVFNARRASSLRFSILFRSWEGIEKSSFGMLFNELLDDFKFSLRIFGVQLGLVLLPWVFNGGRCWEVHDFFPIAALPNGDFLTSLELERWLKRMWPWPRWELALKCWNELPISRKWNEEKEGDRRASTWGEWLKNAIKVISASENVLFWWNICLVAEFGLSSSTST